jgi:class 3 adenylate cyclase
MILGLLGGLPVAVWLDLHALTETNLLRQADELNAAISSVRAFYTSEVVDRVLSAPGTATQVSSNYEALPGAIPIPATLSIALGDVISQQQRFLEYRFVSDYPFAGRAPHPLDAFERSALADLRADPSRRPTKVTRDLLSDRARLIVPIVMGGACVACHNTSPDSPKRDWKIGDIRGIQEISVSQPIAYNLLSFKYLLIYFVCMASMGYAFIRHQNRQTTLIQSVNADLARNNAFLETLSTKISKYLSPQIYKSLFSGQKEAAIQTERKRLTIFFSDIKDFTATTERLQPEHVTALLNEYFTEMAIIAEAHGGTIDKFVGDAMLVFFGDPDTRGVVGVATACLRMAFAMQKRLAELDAEWRKNGVEQPFRARMGINTGYCNVGNFGSADRMHYTIIGAEANLAARLQAIAEPGEIVISFETYSAVRDILIAHPRPPMRIKGVSRDVTPYAVKGMLDANGGTGEIFAAHMTGVDVHIDPGAIAAEAAPKVRALLQRALMALDASAGPEA